MAKYVSKYTGEEIESILDKSTISYTKPNDGIPKSDLSSSIQESLNDISNKVDKVSGKQLSTEDFTTALKNKLNSLSNYDDTTVNNAISGLQSQINTLVNGNASTAIESFNEIIAFLNGVTDSQSLGSIIASIEQQIAEKMDKVTLAKVATSGSYNDLTDKPTIPAEQVNADWNATSGKAQILNKPTIPSAVTESTVSGWGFTKNTGTYSKPSAGIPKSDLASAVQTSLSKANTALQSYTEKYKGTVTKVKINGIEKTPDANGLVDLGTIEGGSGGNSNNSGFVQFAVSSRTNTEYAYTTTSSYNDTKHAHEIYFYGTFIAPANMTWENFVNSTYNPGLFKMNSGSVSIPKFSSTGCARIAESITSVIENKIYYIDTCCFVAGTLIKMSDGSEKPIEQVKVGDFVKSYDVESGCIFDVEVKNTITKYHNRLLSVSFENRKSLLMALYHPLYTTSGWHSYTGYNGYDTLKVGDYVITESANVKITELKEIQLDAEQITYNLNVAGNEINDNYFANGFVAHNAGCK